MLVDTKDITLYGWSYHAGVSSLGPTAPALAGAVYSHLLFDGGTIAGSERQAARFSVVPAQKTSRHLFRSPITARGVRAKAAAVIKNSGPGPAASYMGAAA